MILSPAPTNFNLRREIAEFVLLERRCCPFLNFQISLKEGYDAITVCLSGRDGVKGFLAAEFDLKLSNKM